jgi:hypothetical protein
MAAHKPLVGHVQCSAKAGLVVEQGGIVRRRFEAANDHVAVQKRLQVAVGEMKPVEVLRVVRMRWR